jgi:hypothetical protein
MSHENRLWFAECLSNFTYTFLITNIEACENDDNVHRGAVVEIGGRKFRRNLTQITREGVDMLEQHKKKFDLRFNIYMAESKGAKITRWVM